MRIASSLRFFPPTLIALAAHAALAQSASTAANANADAEVGELKSVVVTAQRRNERIQDVPITMSAFTGDTLKQLGVVRVNYPDRPTTTILAGRRRGTCKGSVVGCLVF